MTHRTLYSRTGIRAVRVAPLRLPPLRANEAIRGRCDTPSEILAKSLIAAVAGSGDKLRHRSIAGLRAAMAILGQPAVELRDVARLVGGLPDTPHLGLLRRGYVADDTLWRDVRDAYKMSMAAPVTVSSPARLGLNLAIVECLLSVPEAERAAAFEMEAA